MAYALTCISKQDGFHGDRSKQVSGFTAIQCRVLVPYRLKFQGPVLVLNHVGGCDGVEGVMV